MMHRAYSILNVKSADDERRIILGTATTPSPDRVGDIVEPLGVKFKNPLPLLWQHRSDQPVGTVKFNKPTKDGITFEARIPKIDEAGPLKDRVDTAWGEVKTGLVRGVSIGFRDIEFSRLESGGLRFIETEVLELSLVTIPAQAEATIDFIKSIDTELLAASGNEQQSSDREHSAGVTARKATPVVKAKEPKQIMAKKTTAEYISANEATRQAKAARQKELMDDANEKGETLDEAGKQEYDALSVELKDIDEHLVRLHEQENANKAAAVEVKGNTQEDASKSRGGVRVEGVKPNIEKGVNFARYAMALAVAKGNTMQAYEIAKANTKWHDQTPEVEAVLKAAVAAGTTTDANWAAPLVQYQVLTEGFIEYLRGRSILDRIPGLRRVPFHVKVQRQTGVASVGWVGESNAKPVSSLAFDTVTLDQTKVAGIVVQTEELVRLSNPASEILVRDDLAAGIVDLIDNDFIDPDKAAVANTSPASITNGVTAVTASGTGYSNFVTDVTTIFNNFDSANIESGIVIVMRQGRARSMGLMLNALGQRVFPDLGQDGGSMMGLPVITSTKVPNTEGSPEEGSPIIFIAAPEIMLADDGQVMLDVSREASVQMDSAPDNPGTASTVLVSLWQRNLVGIRAERMINWVKRRAAAVQYIKAAKYA